MKSDKLPLVTTSAGVEDRDKLEKVKEKPAARLCLSLQLKATLISNSHNAPESLIKLSTVELYCGGRQVLKRNRINKQNKTKQQNKKEKKRPFLILFHQFFFFKS